MVKNQVQLLGLFQWESWSSNTKRFKDMNDYCKSHFNQNWNNCLQGQLEYSLNGKEEMSTCFSSYSKLNYGKLVTLNEFKNFTDVVEATKCFELCFERSSIKVMETRVKYARAYYTHYSGKTVSIPSGNSSFIGPTPITLGSGGSSAIADWGEGGKDIYVIAQADESKWITGITRTQSNETAANYISKVLCKSAVSVDGNEAGFKYYVDAKGHHFESIGYSNVDSSTSVEITYGEQNSDIISFSVANLGTLAMMWGTGNKTVVASTSYLDELTGEILTVGNIYGEEEKVEEISNNLYTNWYDLNVEESRVQVVSSGTESGISSNLSSMWNELNNLTVQADLTVWGTFSNRFRAGGYVKVIICGTENVHYTSGIYLITSIDDNVSTNSYTQSMKLIRLNESYSKESINENQTVQENEGGVQLTNNKNVSDYTYRQPPKEGKLDYLLNSTIKQPLTTPTKELKPLNYAINDIIK